MAAGRPGAGPPQGRVGAMSPEWDALVDECHQLGLKIGPLAERPNGEWRAYLQKGTEIFRCSEGPTIVDALRVVLEAVKVDHLAKPAAESFMD